MRHQWWGTNHSGKWYFSRVPCELVNRDFCEDQESLSSSFALSLFDVVRFLLFRISRRRRTHFWPRLVLEARRGQRSGKRLSLRHCHTILPRPVAWISLFCSPDAITSRTYVQLILSLLLSPLVHLFPSNSIDWSSVLLPRTLDHFASVHLRQWVSFFLVAPPGRFPRSISSLTNDKGLIRRIRLCFCFSLDFRCYSDLLKQCWAPRLTELSPFLYRYFLLL